MKNTTTVLTTFLAFASLSSVFISPTHADIWNFNLGSEQPDGTWKAKNRNESITVPAVVPGGIYTDLETAGVLTSPLYYRFNDENYRWVSKEDWTYTRTFTIDALPLQKKRILLLCKGLDTVSTVTINDEDVGNSNNMFIKYGWDIKQIVKKGDNKLSVAFQSPVTYSAEQYEIQLLNYIVPPECVTPKQHGVCHANFIRKMQASFSWDWGPAFPSMGIWQDISIEAFDSAVLRDVTVSPTPQTNEVNGTWNVVVTSYFDTASTLPEEGVLTITFLSKEGLEILYTQNVTLISDSNKKAILPVSFQLQQGSQFDLWWPNGYGQQPLYNLTVSFESNHVEEQTSKSIKVGFRSVELVQDPVANNTGLTYYFRINNVPIFMKGSNWIPAHVLPEQVTTSYLQDLLYSASEAHMNMLRVWGGGIYELDAFYQLADEYGIMIWQDLMYACAMYPSTPEFLSISGEEVKTQVLRLQHHPSIAIWAGNNENEAALIENWYGTAQELPLYKSDYVKLYVDTLKPIVTSLDPARPYVTSSPSNGLVTEAQGYVAGNPQSTMFGDVHYYNYASDGWDWSTFPRPRFASEFGFQSWPSFETMKNVTIPKDWSFFSRFTYNRNHHPNGNMQILAQVERHFDQPPALNSESGYRTMLYLSQLNQAMSTKTESESYRRGKSELQPNGEGLTMGSLYWQLNDIWQGASWASIEFGGKWKVLHYYAIKFYAPVLVSPFVDNNNLNIYVVNDYQHDVEGSVQISVYGWDSLTQQANLTVPFQMQSLSAHSIYSSSLDVILDNTECNNNRNNCFLIFKFEENEGQSLGPDNFIFLGQRISPAYGVQKAAIEISNVSSSYSVPSYVTAFNITITTDSPAPFVWLEAEGINGNFEDNGFLLTEPQRTVAFYAKQEVDVATFERSLSVKSLLDFYSEDDDSFNIATNSLHRH